MTRIKCIKDKFGALIPIDKIEYISSDGWVSAGGSRRDIPYDYHELLLGVFEDAKTSCPAKAEEIPHKPKFKILRGNWYLCIKDCVSFTSGKVYNCPNHWYLTNDDGDNVYFYTSIPYMEHFRPWTIEDAKPGDVLAAEEDGETWIGIFKAFDPDNKYFFSVYCQLPFGEDKVEIDVDTLYSEGCHPATKEQRDLLFKKMHEAGYEWDAEQKQLKKIEQKLFGVKRKKKH